MGKPKTNSLPLVPLPRGTVLLPGLLQGIPVTPNRPDIAALLAHVYERAAAKGPDTRLDTIPIVCLPLGSPFVGPGGQLLINNGEEPDLSRIEEVNPAQANQADLFSFGTAAKISGIDGRGSTDFALRVEGTARVRIEHISKNGAYLEGKVTYFQDEGRHISSTSWSRC